MVHRLIPAAALLLAMAACAGGDSAPAGTDTVAASSATEPSPASSAPPSTPSSGDAPGDSSSTTTTGGTEAPATTVSPGDDATATTSTEPLPLAGLELRTEVVATGFAQPVFAVAAPGDDRLFIVDQVGRIDVLDEGRRSTFLDLTDRVVFGGEQGLLGLAFHPGHADNGRLFVHYTGDGGRSVVEEHTTDGDDRVILTVDQPAPNHNGGMIAFGPDGLLYLALGDGGAANDVFGNGQDPSTLLGAILRLDVDGGDPYAIPASNPWASGDGPGAPEVWIYGVRNPWRFSFDGDRVFVADVGQNAWEEVTVVSVRSAGLNLGWPVLEGGTCFTDPACDPGAFTAPALVYPHERGECSITGGYVYRGTAIPGLAGTYFYGDFCSGRVSSFRLDGEGPFEIRDWPGLTTPGLTSFGVDAAGELLMTSVDGSVYRIVAG